MEKCLLCGADFERVKGGRMACGSCFDKVQDTQARYLTLEERLWGKCYRNGACWEFGLKGLNGRPNTIRADRRQVPPSHVALWLSGHARPSPLHMAEHAHGANAMCVNPEHLRWVAQPKPRGPMWAHLMSPEELATYHERFSAKRAEYQRNWRRRIKTLGGTKSVREARNLRDMARAREVSAAAREAGPTPLVPLARPIVVAPVAPAALAVNLEEHYAASIAEGRRILAAPATTPAPAVATDKPNRAASTLARAQLEAEAARALAVDDDEPIVTLAELAALEAEAAAARAAVEPIPSAPVPAPSAVKPAPARGLLASLTGAKIAPVD